MTLDEAIECLGKIGVDISKATLNRYVRVGLVTAPERGGYGRGGGRWANYSVSAVAEAATAWAMLTKKTQTDELFKELQYLQFTPEKVAIARMVGIFSFYRDTPNEMREYCPSEFLKDLNALEKPGKGDNERLDTGAIQGKYFTHGGVTYEDDKDINEKILNPLLGNVNIPCFFPKKIWASSISVIELFFKLMTIHLYIKIYGGMLLKILNLTEQK